MKKQLTFLFACFFALSAMPARTHASAAVSQEATHAAMAEKMGLDAEKMSKLSSNKKTEKRLNRLAKKLERKAEKRGGQIDFTDPVEQWLWFGVFGLGAAIAFAILELGLLSGLCALAAIACIVIWLIKRGSV